MPGLPTTKPPTRAALEALPENIVGEIIEGVLYTFPRPRAVHSNLEGVVYSDLYNPFQRGRGGPGGWWILVEPGIEFLARQNSSRTLAVGGANGCLICRTMPPSKWFRTGFVRSSHGVPAAMTSSSRSHSTRESVSPNIWLVDPAGRTLTVSKLENGRWVEIGVFGEGNTIRAEPFADVELSMSDWWPPASVG